MKCKDCYHNEICPNWDDYNDIPYCDGYSDFCNNYDHFKEKSLIVELPCKVGRFVYADIRLFCTDCLKEEVRKSDYICCTVVNVRYDKNMKALIYLRPFYRRDFNSCYHIFVPSNAIGITVFLTEQEAKAKLKELKK